MKRCGLLAGCVFAAVAAFGFDEPGNLLRDFEFNDPAKVWSAKKATRAQLESFEGMPHPLFYLQGPAGETLHQTFTVEAKSWYVVSFRYRDSPGATGILPVARTVAGAFGERATKGIGPNFVLTVAPGETDNAYPAKTYLCEHFGSSEKWAKAQCYFFAREAGSASLNLRFFQPEWQIGRLVIRKMTEADVRSGRTQDDILFENTRPGEHPLYWRLTGPNRVNCRDLTFTEDPQNVHGGKRALAVTFTNNVTLVSPPCAVMRNRDAIRAAVWIKVTRRSQVEFKTTAGVPGVSRSNRYERQWVKPNVWTRFEVVGTPQCPDSLAGHTSLIHGLFAKSEDGGPVTLFMDDLSFSVTPPGEDGAWGDPKSPKLPNSSFEAGAFGMLPDFYVDSTNVHDGVTRRFEVDDTTAAVGTCSLKVYGDGFYFWSEPFRCFADQEYTVSFWAKSTKPIKVSVGYPYARVGWFDVGPEWKRFTGTCAPKREYVAPGFCHLRFETKGAAKDNVLWLDGFQLDYGKEAKPYRAEACEIGATFDAIYKIFSVGAAQRLDLRVANGGEKPLAGEVVLSEKDVRGNVTRSERFPATVAPGGSWLRRWDYPVPAPGYHRVETVFVAGGQTLASNVTTYAAVLPPKPVPYEKSWAGMLSGVDQSGRGGATYSYMDIYSGTWNDALDALELMGVKWIRVFAAGNWRNTEYPQGTLNWKWDAFMKDIKARKMGIMVENLGFEAPEWSHGRDLTHTVTGGFRYSMRPQDVERYAEQFARHYSGLVDAICILGETCGHDPDDYVELMEAYYKGSKRGNPTIGVHGPGFPSSKFPVLSEVPGQETWIQRALDLGLNKWNDLHDIHPYDYGHGYQLLTIKRQGFERSLAENPDAEGRTEYEYICEQARRFKAKYPNNVIWDGESGAAFNTAAPWQATPIEGHLDWYTERLAAARAVRCNILRWSFGVERQFYFMFRFHLAYHQLDLLNHDMTPRAGVAALSNFYRVLDGGTCERVETRKDGTFLAYFTGWKGEKILVYWNPELDEEEVKVEKNFDLPSGLKAVSACDMEGAELKTLPLSCEPVYVIYE